MFAAVEKADLPGMLSRETMSGVAQFVYIVRKTARFVQFARRINPPLALSANSLAPRKLAVWRVMSYNSL